MSDFLSPDVQERNTWFPVGRDNELGWHLDIVSLLAVIHESAMEIHAQRTTVSWLCLLPRLIPAPQGLLKADRPKRLPPVAGVKVVGAYSATKVEELNFAANLIHNIRDLKPFEFQEWVIAYDEDYQLLDNHLNVIPPKRLQVQNLSVSRMEEGQNDATQSQEYGTTYLVANRLSPANVLTFLSCLATVGIFIWAFLNHDAVAALAVALLSSVSSLTGLASKWTPKLEKRTATAPVPDGDLVLRTRSGAFVVVHCNEQIARELYTGIDACNYFCSANVARSLKGFATLFLMVAVVLLGNCKWSMQAVIGAAYLILNGAYWLASLLSETWYWHLRGSKAFDMRPQEYRDAKEASISRAFRVLPDTWLPPGLRTSMEEYSAITVGAGEKEVTHAVMLDRLARAHEGKRSSFSDGLPEGKLSEEDKRSYTRTLWYAILRSGSTDWIAPGEAAPIAPWWSQWIKEASNHLDDVDWKAVSLKTDLLTQAQEEKRAQREAQREAQRQRAAQRTRRPSSVTAVVLGSTSTSNGTITPAAQVRRPTGVASAHAALPPEDTGFELRELEDDTVPGASRPAQT